MNIGLSNEHACNVSVPVSVALVAVELLLHRIVLVAVLEAVVASLDSSSLELEHQQTIDVADRHAIMDFVQPINVQRPNRDVHLLNPF